MNEKCLGKGLDFLQLYGRAVRFIVYSRRLLFLVEDPQDHVCLGFL